MNATEVARTIRSQIHMGTALSLGMHNATTVVREGQPGLQFLARILPFRKDGTRGQSARAMTVEITLNPLDLYDIKVYYLPRRSFTPSMHYEAENIDVSTLNRLLLALDWDGPKALNPRYL